MATSKYLRGTVNQNDLMRDTLKLAGKNPMSRFDAVNAIQVSKVS